MIKIKYININDDRFWQILFDEACVEGEQAERIQRELEKISVNEKEIIRKVFDRVFKRMNAISYREESNDCNTFGDVPHYVVSLPAIKQILKEEIDINERD